MANGHLLVRIISHLLFKLNGFSNIFNIQTNFNHNGIYKYILATKQLF